MNDFDEKIEYLYQMRHACNLFGAGFVAKDVKISTNRVIRLYESFVHGSEKLSQFKGCSDQDFEKRVSKLEGAFIEREEKKEALIENLREKRHEFAGIGTNKAKRRLNKLSLVDPVAKAIRLALEIEDKNILAKNTNPRYRDKVYKVKAKLISDLAQVFVENNWKWGIQQDESQIPPCVIYFEIPDCEQISWHIFRDEYPINFPEYGEKWDGKENSTLDKLEQVAAKILSGGKNEHPR